MGSQYFSIIGQAGYNPIISSPEGLTRIDPAWNANCRVAPFQGSDPPKALQPASDLMPLTTSADLEVVATPVKPVQMLAGVLSPTASRLQISTNLADLPMHLLASASAATFSKPSPNNLLDSDLRSLFDPRPFKSINVSPPSSSCNAFSKGQKLGQDLSAPLPDLHSDLSLHDPHASAGLLSDSAAWIAEASKPFQLSGTAAILWDGREIVTADVLSLLHISSEVLIPGENIVSLTTTLLASLGGTVVIGSNTESLDNPITSGAPASSISGHPFTGDSASAFIIRSQTIAPGAVIIVSGTLLSLPLSGSYIIEGTSSVSFTSAVTNTTHVAEQAYAMDSDSDITVGSWIFTPRGTIIVSGTSLLFPLSVLYVLQGASTVPISSFIHDAASFAGQVYTANSASGIIVGSQTLMPGDKITVSGTLFLFPISASYIIQGTSTIPLPLLGHKTILLADQQYTINSASGFNVASQILATSGTTTVLETTPPVLLSTSYTLDSTSTISATSLGPTPTSLANHYITNSKSNSVSAGMLISQSTTPTDIASVSSTQGLGGLIMSGLSGLSGLASGSQSGMDGIKMVWRGLIIVRLGWGVIWVILGL